ncbi:MAG: ubiquinol-cytochrome c reductase iron-sulfur subunit [Candidatus Jettenia sp.]|uniref:Rieske domain-containing protein n=1 Tax=Candidatus Jettenia caeni TaxID=247490 RepID=I3IQC2_9BACT|nr:ubiquinol-cytochrome c reductase iron-sulfur subunit [Candidatus Jettenia sp. AMX1]MBC6927980.1 ubiquinol-cytochrome c reductase iron-sulfur subunit [Candidatus Jettenia sp.]NUN24333.1 ubiquinol-cytochrome c reductase iron-sulfur subunit [Candidatus Jettenia caeni]KAA0248891.1 MAG: ubiquinol-cytochrome c reductase iron-sulfur subunit [Candidatus Jettenia sp. AMX1]MCE7880987.1 ubiquinol-cytochrome c reductase iron-sulfur subunit [Candidatus Jettenia sp. AMX1]MDL1939240.1 ubiquinol-cytochrome
MEAKEKTRRNTSETEGRIWFNFSRRNFLTVAGWGLFFATIGAYLSQILGYKGFFYPKVLFEPSPKFAVGEPKSFPENSVTTLKSRKIFVVRDGNSFKAISVVCQHLGCAVEFSKEKNIFECPCHGSKYYRNGVNFAGPAPRPLSHFEVVLSDSGKLVVDTSKIVPIETELIV